jgi:hypothetical protein
MAGGMFTIAGKGRVAPTLPTLLEITVRGLL